MKKILTIAFLTALIGLAGCESSSTPAPVPDTPSPPPPAAQMVVINAVADAPGLTVNVGGPPPAGSDLLALPFNGVANSSFLPGAFDVSVDMSLLDGTILLGVVPAANIDFVVDTRTTIVVTGAVGGMDSVVLTQPVQDAAALGNVRLRVLHAAVGVGIVDVYATAPDADLTASAPIATIAFQEDSGIVDVPAGDYQIRVTPTGTPAVVVFDSGTATLVGGEDILAVAVNNTRAGTSPINLLIADATSGNSDVVVDADGEADTRFVHASPDAGPVDVLADGAPLAEGLVYTEFEETEGLAAATYNIQVTAAGDPTMEFFQVDIGLAPGGRYEGIALGSALAAPVEPPAADAFTVLLTAFGAEDYRSITTEAKLRLVHGSVAYADGADIYVVEAGTDITMEDATVAGAVIGASSGFLSLFPGSYDIVITVNDEVTMMDVEVLRINGVALAGGGIYSAVAIDDLGAMGMLDIIGIDDLAP